MVRRSVLLTAAAVAALALALALPGAAGANAYTTVYSAFTAHGTIKPCEFSAATLHAAESETPNYDQQYFADFGAAIQSALSARVGGVCAGGANSSLLGGTSPSLNGTGGGPLPTSVRASTSSGVPLTFVLLAVLISLLAAGGAILAVAWRRGAESGVMADWRHACEEASFRISGQWEELTDRRQRRARKQRARKQRRPQTAPRAKARPRP